MRWFALLGLALFVAATQSPLNAASFTVTNTADSGGGSLRQAIIDANSTDEADTITITATGTITLTSGPLPAISKPVTIVGPGANSLTLNANAQGAGIQVNSGVTASITGITVTGATDSAVKNAGTLTLSNSVLSGNTTLAAGAGLYNTGAATLTNVNVNGNWNLLGGNNILPGGGLANAATGNLTMNGGSISNNKGPGDTNGGGGLHNQGTAALTSVTVNGNIGANAGGIDNEGGTLTLTSSTVSNNQGFNGPGIWNRSVLNDLSEVISTGDLTVTSSLIFGNSHTSNLSSGGGIFNLRGVARVSNSTLRDNRAGNGGNIMNRDGNFTLDRSTVSGSLDGSGIWHGWPFGSTGHFEMTNSTVSGNTGFTAGGLFVRGGVTMTLTNSTITQNTAAFGVGGLLADSCVQQGCVATAISLKNTIIADQLQGADCRIFEPSTLTSLGHNLDSDGSCSLSQPSDISNAGDAKLGPLANYGGPTLTHAPLPGSPAIDKGDNATCPAVDQRGVARPIDGDAVAGAVCDIGAVERDLTDTDGDGYTDIEEIAIAEDPATYCAIMRADVNHDGTVTISDLAAAASRFLQQASGANARYDQLPPNQRDGQITITDLSAMAARFLQNVSACP